MTIFFGCFVVECLIAQPLVGYQHTDDRWQVGIGRSPKLSTSFGISHEVLDSQAQCRHQAIGRDRLFGQTRHALYQAIVLTGTPDFLQPGAQLAPLGEKVFIHWCLLGVGSARFRANGG
jgi:hypothetical protein